MQRVLYTLQEDGGITMNEEEREIELLNEGFERDQIDEIEEGIRAGVDTSIYRKKEYLAIQMLQIRLGLMEGLPVEKYATAEYDWFQMEEIRKGLSAGLNVEIYAFPDIPYDTMRQIRKGLKKGIDLSPYRKLNAGVLRELRKALVSRVSIVKYIKEGFITEQLKEIRLGLEKGLNIEPYLQKEFLGAAIAEICKGLERGLDVAFYAKQEFSWQQMREIRRGLEKRVDVSVYADELYQWRQMKEIRLGLENGIDVSSYKSLMYTASDMKKKRLMLMGYTTDDTSKKETNRETKEEKALHISIAVSEDEMEAYLTITENGNKYDKQKLMMALKQCGIRYGILEDVIESLASGVEMEAPLVIAKGIEPTRGADGWYEFFFKTEEEKAPKLMEDGSVDYKNTEWFEVVEKGQKIAYYHEAAYGKNGISVLGRAIPSKKGKEKGMLSGKGFVLLPDQRTYLAAEKGVIERKGDYLEVSKLLVMEDMTIASGKVDFDGSVYIKGNVADGTCVKATGDIIVDGFVESADIESGGTIILRQGVNAFSNGVIRAENDVNGKFFEAVKVYANGNIQANYCMNSELYAEGKIMITGVTGTFIGGKACAAQGFQAYNVGNYVGLPTYLKLGVHEKTLRKYNNIQEELKEVHRELSILRNAYSDFRSKYSAEVRNTMPMFLKIENAIFTKEKELDKLEFAKFKLEEKMRSMGGAKAVIQGNLYEGVTVEINGMKWNAKGLRNVTIRKMNNQIAVYTN